MARFNLLQFGEQRERGDGRFDDGSAIHVVA